SVNRVCTTPLSVITVSTWRRACRSPRLAKVIRRSANGRSRRALASVVVILPCSNKAVARFARMCRWWAALPPSRGPLVGVGIELLSSVNCFRVRVAIAGPRDISASQARDLFLSVLFGLDVTLVVVPVVVVHGAAGVKPRRGVLESQAHVGQLLLDFLDRLGAEVADVEQVLLAARDEFTHGVNAFALQAVVRPDG